MGRLYVPSWSMEGKTRVFNKYIAWYSALALMFTVGVGVNVVFACVISLMDLMRLIWFMLMFFFVPMAFFVILSYQPILMAFDLMRSYRFEQDRIIRGSIQGMPDGELTVISANMNTITAARGYNIIRRIINNMDPDFTKMYFDTPVYKKEVFMNPHLEKETKKALIFRDASGKKLVIPKIYEGMCQTKSEKKVPFLFRVFVPTALISILSIGLAVAIIGLGFVFQNVSVAPKVNNTQTTVGNTLTSYGYSLQSQNTQQSVYKLEVDNLHTQTVTYQYAADGTVKKMNVQLYYNSSYVGWEDELRAIIDSSGENFSNQDIDKFIDGVKDKMNGELNSVSMNGKVLNVRVGTSGDYVDIH